MPEVASTALMPARPHMSSATPPSNGTEAPSTPDRPPVTVSATPWVAQARTTATTPSTSVGRATAPASAGTCPSVAQTRPMGHQSRECSASTAGVTSTSTPVAPRISTKPSGSGDSRPKRDAASAGSPASAMPGVGAPVPSGRGAAGV